MEKLPLTLGSGQRTTPPGLNAFDELLYSKRAGEAKSPNHLRIACEDLFSMFTANIIKARKIFTR